MVHGWRMLNRSNKYCSPLSQISLHWCSARKHVANTAGGSVYLAPVLGMRIMDSSAASNPCVTYVAHPPAQRRRRTDAVRQADELETKEMNETINYWFNLWVQLTFSRSTADMCSKVGTLTQRLDSPSMARHLHLEIPWVIHLIQFVMLQMCFVLFAQWLILRWSSGSNS